MLPQRTAESSVCLDSFRNYWHVLDIHRPRSVLIIHGDMDSVVPWRASETLARAIRAGVLWDFWTVHGAGHNNLRAVATAPVFEERLTGFLTALH